VVLRKPFGKCLKGEHMESAVVKVATKANVAQLVECIHGKDEVTSSILVIGSKNNRSVIGLQNKVVVNSKY
jgi:hypothetical protein